MLNSLECGIVKSGFYFRVGARNTWQVLKCYSLQLFCIICHRSKFQEIIALLGCTLAWLKEFIHAKGQWSLTLDDSLGSREDFQRIPELAINPLGDRIINAFFPEGWVPIVVGPTFWGYSGRMILIGSSHAMILSILGITNWIISRISPLLLSSLFRLQTGIWAHFQNSVFNLCLSLM